MIITLLQLKSDTVSNRLKVNVNKVIKQLFHENEEYIFISHKHSEVDYVYRLKDILDRYGYEGYVDWNDKEMPKETSVDTAKILRDRIISAKKFILIATDDAIDSKWCNWEIGFADAHKYADHLALFPIKEEAEEYTGSEYLNLYSSIQVESYSKNPSLTYYVRYPDGSSIDLEEWLKK